MSLRELELLAPAGQMEVLHRVVEAGADAAYIGGKRFNMRALKSDFNFSQAQISEAVEYVHQRNRKLYITVNNLYNNQEILEIKDYLVFLKQVGVDALIVQDLGIVELCRQMQLGIPLHASVQMGIANLEAVRLLEDQGFQRVILSKNVSLPEMKTIAAATNLGLEYFVHGDQCISHAGQCYMSSYIAGESGNQGRCRKPCRWPYTLKGEEQAENGLPRYYLAHKDLCLYPYLKELVEAGISSFKIEGRMRGADYLAFLVSSYRQALDRLIEEGENYRTDERALEALNSQRVRDFTSGNLFGPMGAEGIGLDGSREPFFVTTAQPLSSVEKCSFDHSIDQRLTTAPELSVRVMGSDGVEAIADLEVDNVILGWERIRQKNQHWTLSGIEKAVSMLSAKPGKVYIETPRIVSQRDLDSVAEIRHWVQDQPIQGLIVNDLGSLRLLRDTGLSLWAGYGLNTFNSWAAGFLQGLGVSRVVASLELKAADLHMMLGAETPTEVVVQGLLPGLITDYCVISAAHGNTPSECAHYCLQDDFSLVDSCGQQYRIVCDEHCRNYIMFPYQLCLLPYVQQISQWGARSLRIEGQYYQGRELRQVVALYQQAIRRLTEDSQQEADNWGELEKIFPGGVSFASFGQY